VFLPTGVAGQVTKFYLSGKVSENDV
jgi:hypothetical protein